MASEEDAQIEILVREMGFAQSEAAMALRDCHGNIESAIDKLTSGIYSPPPYAEIGKDRQLQVGLPSKSIPGDNSKTNNSSLYPPLYPDSHPPPYTKASLETEIKVWENDCPATFFKLDKSFGSAKEMRCSSCFDVIYDGHEKSGMANKAVKDGPRVCMQVFQIPS